LETLSKKQPDGSLAMAERSSRLPLFKGTTNFLWITEYPDASGIGKSLLSAAPVAVVTETLEPFPLISL